MPPSRGDQERQGGGTSLLGELARARPAAGWLGPWLAVAALALWTSSPTPLALVVAAAGVTLSLFAPLPRRRGWSGIAWVAGTVVLVAEIALGFAAHRQIDRVLFAFEDYWAERDTTVGRILQQELDRRLQAGLAATGELSAAASARGDSLDVATLRQIRARHGPSALALYGPGGSLLVWDGEHRGRVPETVQRGERRHEYHDLPLFGYLYTTSVAEDGSVAVAAHLLRSNLPESVRADLGDFATAFYRQTRERIRVAEEDPGPLEGIVWDLVEADGSRILSVVVEEPVPEERARQLGEAWTAAVAGLVLAAWLLLAWGGPRRVAGAAVAAATLLAIAAWAPLGHVPPIALLFDSSAFELPGPLPMSLGRSALVGLAAFTLVSVLPRPRISLPPWGVGLAAAAAFPLALAWLEAGLVPGGLAESRLAFVSYQAGAAALLSLVAGTLIAFARVRGSSPWAALWALAIGLALGAGGAAWVWRTASHPPVWTALWGLPAAIATYGVGAWQGWQRSLLTWGIGIVLGGTAAIPAAWSKRIEARMLVGERTLLALAQPEDPELERALLRFASLADSLDEAGASDVGLLYHGWRLSGLAEGGYPVWLQLWRRDGSPGEGLRVGTEGGEPLPLGAALREAWRTGGVRLHRWKRDDARYILTVPLAAEEIVSVVAPPFAVGASRGGLGPLLQGSGAAALAPITVIPLLPGDAHATDEPRWVRTDAGWQAEMALAFENGTAYHAHYLVTLPGEVVAIARASLLLAMNFAAFLAFWLIGQGLLHDTGRRSFGLAGLTISFRGRVTLALFGFFALANALFGTVAYTTLTQASRRSAQVIAERVVEDAAGWYRTFGGRMDRLARQVGAELIQYREGELAGSSVEEMLELGLYEGWVPYDVDRMLRGREDVYRFTNTSVGRFEYVTAYRGLAEGDVLAAQVPLQAGATALQTSDLVELLGFVVLLGALLSAGLAMLAGRALTRPILALQIASERVGAGNLAQRLPDDRSDEFGAVFRAFNRMVTSVRRARRQLVRTSRRTQLIMDEAAVGMVALDALGRVTLVNPRAEELLGAEVVSGKALPRQGPLGEALARWLAEFLDGTDEEADRELQAGERRVRARVRRFGGSGARRGVVLAMDDVTDELRAERVLAWGEMARQVAHEVKNPLTPIKLSIQHVRRAWEDAHPDFEQILLRNADAMLAEIDRLAGIAQSFARFGAPGENVAPLSEVSVAEVVGEVMALYSGPDARVRFDAEVEAGLPGVVARATELKEVLVNLLENSRLAGATRVRIRATRDESGVVVSVADDGSGIPEDVLPRIFEPKFSTRSTGTGLGLAIVQRLVASWGGSVSVRSEPGAGTVVAVSVLPWSRQGPGEGSHEVSTEAS